MSFDKNILKILLNKLLESRLKRLEKRNIEEEKDLKILKAQYKSQGELLAQLTIRKKKAISRKKTFDKNNFNYKSPIRKKQLEVNPEKYKLSTEKRSKIYPRYAVTPLRPKNNTPLLSTRTDKRNLKTNISFKNKYSYVKSRYMNIPKNNINRNNQKLSLTPEPKIKWKKRANNKNKKNNNIIPSNLILQPSYNNKEKNNQIIERNITTIKNEDEKAKVRKNVSIIGLEADEISFVLEELKKEDEKDLGSNNDKKSNKSKDSSNSSSDSNVSSTCSNQKSKQIIVIKNKEIVNKFSKYLISSDGSQIFNLISSFLEKKTKINFLSISKKVIKYLIYYLDDLYKDLLQINKVTSPNTIEEEINKIKSKYKEDELDSPKFAFSLSKNSVNALNLLDSESYNNIFKIKILDPPLNKIIFIYRIFFQLLDREELIKIESDKFFWEKARNYILENNEGKTGTYIREYISEFDYTEKNIYQLKKLINGKEDKLSPLIYQNICKTTECILYIIKDSLEYCGIIQNDEKTMPSIVINYLEHLQNNIKIAKEYIDSLKQL